jgi:antirestriction protein ArdC
VEYLEKGVRPWVRPWTAEHAAGRITRPLRFNGQPYSGINVLSLWMSALRQNFTASIWMTYRQATESNAHVRKGEKGSPVVYANAITRTEHDDKTGQDVEREIPYMKGYTVFNVEQIDGLPEIYSMKVAPTLDSVARIDHAESFSPAWERRSSTAETEPTMRRNSTTYRCRPSRPSVMPRATTPPSRMN